MIKSITVTNFKNESLVMELSNPWESGLNIKNIEGLGPPKAEVSATELSSTDGAVFTGARIANRQIIFTIAPMETPSVEVNRQKTYRYFPLKKKLKIQVESDNRMLETEGYVESNEPDIFSKDETTVISVLCLDPYFYKAANVAQAFSGVQPLFEFPFSNESLTQKLIEFGNVRIDKRAIIYYEGDIDTGVEMVIHIMGNNVTGLTVYNTETLETMRFDTDRIKTLTGVALSNGDDILVSTIPGKKYCKLLRGGKYTNIIAALSRDSDWFVLTPGDNIFLFTANTGEDDVMITFNFRPAYGGI